MNKVLYVHGYGGKENGNTSQLIQKYLGNDYEVIAPQFDYSDLSKVIGQIKELSKDYKVIVASSLGAFCTMQTQGSYKVLINTAFPADVYGITEDEKKYEEMLYLMNTFFMDHFDEDYRYETNLVFGDKDNIANNKVVLSNYYYKGRIHTVDCGHHCNDECAKTVANIVKGIFNENH